MQQQESARSSLRLGLGASSALALVFTIQHAHAQAEPLPALELSEGAPPPRWSVTSTYVDGAQVVLDTTGNLFAVARHPPAPRDSCQSSKDAPKSVVRTEAYDRMGKRLWRRSASATRGDTPLSTPTKSGYCTRSSLGVSCYDARGRLQREQRVRSETGQYAWVLQPRSDGALVLGGQSRNRPGPKSSTPNRGVYAWLGGYVAERRAWQVVEGAADSPSMIHDMVEADDLAVITVGQFATEPATRSTYLWLAKWAADGKQVWSHIAGERPGPGHPRVSLYADGRIVVAAGDRLERYDARGQRDPSFTVAGPGLRKVRTFGSDAIATSEGRDGRTMVSAYDERGARRWSIAHEGCRALDFEVSGDALAVSWICLEAHQVITVHDLK